MNQFKMVILLVLCVLTNLTKISSQDTAFQTQGFFVTRDYNMLSDAAQLKDGHILVSGFFNFYNNVSTTNIIRMNQDGTQDRSFDSSIGTDGTINKIVIQNDGKIILQGVFSRYKQQTVTASLIRITPDGILDNSFHAYVPYYNYNATTAIALQNDGKIILAGFGLGTINSTSNGILRLNADGTLDNTFSIGFILQNTDFIQSMLVQEDGKILVGGYFSNWNGISVTGLVRLNSDGSIDSTFRLSGLGLQPATGNSLNVNVLLQLPDKNLLIGGNFSYYNTTQSVGIVKLHLDGTIDTSLKTDPLFQPYGNFNVQAVALLPNKILVGGHFYISTGAYKDIIPINYNGSIDSSTILIGPDATKDMSAGGPSHLFINSDGSFISFGIYSGYYDNIYLNDLARFTSQFHADTNFHNDFQRKGLVSQTAVQSDSKIIVSGDFNQYGINNQSPRQYIARLNSDGTLDNTFVNTQLNGLVTDIALQNDNYTVAVGSFTSSGSVLRNGIARFTPNGNIDFTFNPGSGPDYNNMYCVHLQNNQYIYIGGGFSTFSGYPHQGIVRLLWNGSVDQAFNTANTPIYAPSSIESTSDGKILSAESSDKTIRDYTTPLRIFRLNNDGSLDNSFHTPSIGWSMSKKVAIGKQGKIYWLGLLIQAASPNHFTQPLICMNSDGTLDASAVSLPDSYYISDFKILPDSNLIICGQQLGVSDSTFFVMRLHPDLTIDSSFTPVGLYYNLKHLDYTSNKRIIVAGEPLRYFGFKQDQVQNVAILENSTLQLYSNQGSGNVKVSNIIDTVSVAQSANVGSTVTQNFSALNPTTLNVSLLDPNKVILSGNNASEFKVIINSNSSSINKTDSLPFSIQFTPSSQGRKMVKVTIPYSNGIENKYTFLMSINATDNITSVTNVPGNNSDIALFPNPSKIKKVYIQTNQIYNSYIVFDLSGKTIVSGLINNLGGSLITIPLDHVGKGVYIIKLKSGNKEVQRKVIILE